MSLNLKQTEAGFSPSSIDSLCLRVAETPRCRDLAIFVRMTDRQPDTQTDCMLYPLLHMRARGVIILFQ
jgi:hypothetical protein